MHLLLLIALAIPQQDGNAALEGEIFSRTTVEPVADALVQVSGAGPGVLSDEGGAYRVGRVAPGWHRVRVERLGYETVEMRVYVGPGSVVHVDVSLPVDPLPVGHMLVDRRRAVVATGGGSAARAAARVGTRNLEIGPDGGSPLERDPLRALGRIAPEAAVRPGLPGGFRVRGGAGDQNRFLLDGAPVLSPVHAAGRGSAVNPDVLSGARLHAGPAPPRYGGAASSVLELESRQPSADGIRLQGSLTSFMGALSAQGPVIVNRVGFVAGARRSHGGLLSAPLGDPASTARFHDLFAKASLRIGPGIVSAFTFRSRDRLTLEPDEDGYHGGEPPPVTPHFGWSTATDAVTWAWSGGGGVSGRVVAWRARLASDGSRLSDPGAVSGRLVNQGVRTEATLAIGRGTLAGGLTHERTALSYTVSGASGLSLSDIGHRTVGFLEARGAPGEDVGITVGVRVGSDAGEAGIDVSPRIAVDYAPAQGVELGIAYGRTRQQTKSFRNEDSPLDVALPVDMPGALPLGEGGIRSDLLVARARRVLLGPTAAEVQAFAKRTVGLIDVASATRGLFLTSAPRPARSRSRGLTILVTGDWKPWSGRVWYAWTETRLITENAAYRPGFEPPHRGYASLSRTLGGHWTTRASLWVGWGGRTSPVEPGFEWEPDDPVVGEGGVHGTARRVSAGVNTYRLPPSFQLDLAIRGEWPTRLTGRGGYVGTFVSVRNATAHPNVLTVIAAPGTGGFEPVTVSPAVVELGLDFRY